MSSKKWLAQNGFSPMKKIASFEKISVSLAYSSLSSSEGEDYSSKKKKGEEDYEERKEHVEGRGQFDTSICGALFSIQMASSHKRK
jgi:hypothetical protein